LRTVGSPAFPGQSLLAAALTGFLVACLPASAPAAPGAPPGFALDPQRVGWNSMNLEAHKLFISATTEAEWSVDSRESIAGRLIAVPDKAAVPAGSSILTLKVRASMPGIRSSTTLWMDPATANSLQYEIRNSGKRIRERTVRFTDSGAFQRTRRPGEKDDEDKPSTWTSDSSGFWPYSAPVSNTPVLDSLALLYVVAAAPLEKTGDRLEVLVFQGRELARVVLTADRLVDTRVAYQATGADGTRSCRGSVRALRIRLTVLPFGEGPPDFDFLGLKSDIFVLVEPDSRLVLRIEGKAAVIGGVSSALKKARLDGPVRCPGVS
jgi:hypothetical protein